MGIDANYSSFGTNPLYEKSVTLGHQCDCNSSTSAQLPQTMPDTFSKHGSSKKLTTGTKVGIGAAIASAAMAVAVLVVSRGKEKKAAEKALSEIPEELKGVFSKVQNEEGENFINKSYSELVNHMGLSEVAPKTILKDGPDSGFNINGGYNPLENTIGFTNGFFTKMNKTEQIKMMSHELKHCEQFSKMIRSEDLGVEAYAEALTKNDISRALGEGMGSNAMVKKEYNEAVAKGKGEQYLANLKKYNYDKEILERKCKHIKKNNSVSCNLREMSSTESIQSCNSVS